MQLVEENNIIEKLECTLIAKLYAPIITLIETNLHLPNTSFNNKKVFNNPYYTDLTLEQVKVILKYKDQFNLELIFYSNKRLLRFMGEKKDLQISLPNCSLFITAVKITVYSNKIIISTPIEQVATC